MINHVPSFLTAETKEGLVKKMLLNNVKHSSEFQYFDIQKDGKGWTCWYYRKLDISDTVATARVENGS